MLVEMPILSMVEMRQQKKYDAESASSKIVLSREEAEKFIHALPIRGGKDIPEHVNGPKDFTNPKYL